jgi:hypothetical protein
MSARLYGMARWLAILAIALQALWPLLAQARPRSVTLVPICTVGGETHYVELETGGRADTHEDHCKACPVGAAALASSAAGLVVPESVVSAFERDPVSAPLRFISDVRPRAPPFLLSVTLISDNSGRKDEEAIALRHRGNRDAAAGRGVLRRGVLLD